LPRLLCGLLSLAGLFFGALRLAARLVKLLFRLTKLALEALQVALETPDLTFDRVNPIVRGNGLRGRIEREDPRTKSNQSAPFETANNRPIAKLHPVKSAGCWINAIGAQWPQGHCGRQSLCRFPLGLP